MAKNQIAKQQASAIALPEAPSFMDADRKMGLELVSQKIRPPFMKIVQKQSSDELIDQYGIGAVLLVPDNILVLEPDASPIRIVPLFFYVEYLKLASINLKGQESMIKERSTDPCSELARRCANRDLWYEDHPNYPGDDDYRYRNAEALSFICMFDEPHLPNFPFTLSFMKGSYGKGQTFCNQIHMRAGRPLFGSVFALSVDPQLGQNSKGQWRRFLTANPPERPWIEDAEQYAAFRELHLAMKRAYDAGQLEPDYDDEESSTPDSANVVNAGNTY